MVEPKDCPFCGCAGVNAAYPRIIRDQACGIVECFTDGCYAMVVADTLPKAVAAWNRRAPSTGEAGLRSALEEYCRNCNCDKCRRIGDTRSLETTLKSGKPVQCWTCSCGWSGCYTDDDIAEYGEPSECPRCCRERLEPCDPPALQSATPDSKIEGEG